MSWAAMAWLLLCAGAGLAGFDGARAAEAMAGAAMRPDYPVPPADERRLFYLQRSSNANTVVYRANLLDSGELDPKRPVEVYWLRYASNGKKKKLSFVERNFAYGVQARPVDDAIGGYRVHIVALAERPFRVYVDEAGKVQAILELDGRQARLQSVYLEVAEGGLVPGVRHIDVFGVELATGRSIHERIVP